MHLRLRRPGLDSHDFLLVEVDIRIESSTIFVIVSPADKGWPFGIENHTDYTLSLSQKVDHDPLLHTIVSFLTLRQEPEDQPNLTRETPNYILNPRATMDYAWDYPAAMDKKLLLSIKGSSRVVDIMEIGNLVPFKFTVSFIYVAIVSLNNREQDNQRSKAVSLDVRADGYKQILRITNYNAEQSLYKPRNRSASLSRQDTLSGAEAFEAVTEEVETSLSVMVDLGGIGVSLVNKRMVEVIYATIDNFKFEYTDSTIAQAINLTCGHLQVDNQLHEALYPVILQPTPIPKDTSAVGALPTVQASTIWLKDQGLERSCYTSTGSYTFWLYFLEHGVLFIKYFSVLLQALTIEVDEDLLFAMYDMAQIHGLSWDDPAKEYILRVINLPIKY